MWECIMLLLVFLAILVIIGYALTRWCDKIHKNKPRGELSVVVSDNIEEISPTIEDNDNIEVGEGANP